MGIGLKFYVKWASKASLRWLEQKPEGGRDSVVRGSTHYTQREQRGWAGMCLAWPKWWAWGQRKVKPERRGRGQTLQALLVLARTLAFTGDSHLSSMSSLLFSVKSHNLRCGHCGNGSAEGQEQTRGISQEAIAVNQVSLDRAWIRVVITGEGRNIRFCLFSGLDQLNSPTD